jgi:hypothetical protein
VLLRHGMADDVVAGYLARTWPLDEVGCLDAVRSAHVLLRLSRPDSTEAPLE